MPTMTDVELNHYDGHRNLTQGQKNGDGPTLAEQQKLVYDDFASIEAGSYAKAQAPTLTAGAEAADVIAVTFASPVAAVQQYIAEVIDTNSEVNDAAYSIAETGDGAEVSPTGKARLIFTTSAAGAATLSVTDVVGASDATCYLMVRPMLSSAELKVLPAPAEIALTFDAS